MQCTADQRRAIEARENNLLIAAAAGSGKTTVLVERVLSLIEDGENVDDMLIVTFTRAASADMRKKLGDALTKRAKDGDAHARAQLERLPAASICTLHAFCGEILRAHFETVDIDPQARILDDAEVNRLAGAALTDALEEAYERGGEDMAALNFSRGPDKARALADALNRFLSDRPDPDEWMENAIRMAEGDGKGWEEVLTATCAAKLTRAIRLTMYAIELARGPEGPENYAEALEKDEIELSAIDKTDYGALRSELIAFKQTTPRRVARRGENARTDAEARIYDMVTDVRKRVKKTLEDALAIVYPNLETAKADTRACVPALRALARIEREMRAKFTALKESRAAITFADLEHLALKALQDERVRALTRAKYHCVFVDEYQDTSDVQEAIIRLVARENNLFMVGDVKQSIYRFRAAEPMLFYGKYRDFLRGEGGRLIALKQNFRSRRNVLNFVNAVFRRVMTGGDAEIEYDRDAYLYPGAVFLTPDMPVEMHIIDKSDPGEDADETNDVRALTTVTREGVIIAGRIRALMAENPGLRYRDIAILTRDSKNVLPALAQTLLTEGVPAYADASEGYFDVIEVMLMLSLARLIANAIQDIELLSVLRSPMVGLTTTQLAAVRAEYRGVSFYQAAKRYARLDNPLAGRLAAFWNTLSRWRLLSRSMPVARLLRTLMNETGFYAYCGALPGGAQRQANLDMLITRAAAYENATGGGLTDFLSYAQALKNRGDGDGAHTLGENDDVVRLMTIHKSKGLEFRVVFGAMLGRRFHAARAEDTLIAHRALGAALPYIDPILDTRRETLSRRAIAEKAAAEDRAEELRVLYVLLTRAKEHLILTGTVSNLAKARVNWRAGAEITDDYQSALDILASAVMTMPGGQGLIPDGIAPPPACPDAPDVKVTVHPANVPAAQSAPDGRGAREAADLLTRALAGELTADPDPLAEMMNWVYPHQALIHAPVKLTASGLFREIIGEGQLPQLVKRPAFLSEGGVTGTERGTAVHAVLQFLDYGLAPLMIAHQMDAMAARGQITPAMRAAVNENVIKRFVNGPLGLRLRASPRVEREWRFNLRLPASEAVPGSPEDATVLVQGSVDLCFLEDGQWVLIDYKTDRSDDTDELIKQYRPQLALYATALARITGIPVKEKYLCLVGKGIALMI